MPRPIRFQFPGAVYHIFNRGNRQKHIFLNDEDRVHFLKLLSATGKRMNWLCHALLSYGQPLSPVYWILIIGVAACIST